ncbi:hypothetical protein ScPMuIL_017780 [Solemya velum]
MCDAKVLADVRGDLANRTGELGAIGCDLFERMFKRAGVQDMFPTYKGKAVDSIKSEITAHGEKVVKLLVDFVTNADKAELSTMVADFIALHKKHNIPHKALADSQGDIVATLGKFGMNNASWGPFLDFFFNAVKF